MTTMKTTHYHCEHCEKVHAAADLPSEVEAKLIGCSAGLLLGASTKNAWVALGMAALGLMIGHLIDEEVTPKCPLCGVALKAILNSVVA
jgi:hypothetical protein